MDLPGLKAFNAKLNGDRAQLIGFRLQMGLVGSALEHGIPEQMFVTQQNPGEAVSAVKALAKAAQDGQRIFLVTEANVEAVMPNLHIDVSARNEIEAAVAAGKTAAVHAEPISVPGWAGEGYVIVDPVTGDGAYKLAGGTNGAFLAGLATGLLVDCFIVLLWDAVKSGGSGLLIAPFLWPLGATIAEMYNTGMHTGTEKERACFYAGFQTGMSLGALAFSVGGFLAEGVEFSATALGINISGAPFLFSSLNEIPDCLGGKE